QTSSPINITVNNNPTGTLTFPTNNAKFTNGQSITLTADASDDGFVSSVEFFNGPTVFASNSTFPYSANFTFLSNGVYQFKVRVTDDLGATFITPVNSAIVYSVPTI